ncbi:hypothetical protein ATANTOWER_018408 [Ataeniobius toweri]|uniref:Secreted protein n=1 Tax=Ataeniobius toweri TaxID=208326 RepID=A0ABU7AZC3_9TELE|nr:hypothetical protein [Ataeniobius toweri]
MQPILIINVYLLSFSSADKQLYIWTGWDISAEQRGNRGPTAQCANEQSTEKDSAQQAPTKGSLPLLPFRMCLNRNPTLERYHK